LSLTITGATRTIFTALLKDVGITFAAAPFATIAATNLALTIGNTDTLSPLALFILCAAKGSGLLDADPATLAAGIADFLADSKRVTPGTELLVRFVITLGITEADIVA